MLLAKPTIETYPEHLRDAMIDHRDAVNVKMTLGSVSMIVASTTMFRANLEEHLFAADANKAFVAGVLTGTFTGVTGLARYIRDHRHRHDPPSPTVGDILIRDEVRAANQLEDRIAHMVIQPPEADQL